MVLSFERDLKQYTGVEAFRSTGAQNYLEAWCRANGGMRLHFLPRPEWEEVMENAPLIQNGENVEVTVPDDLKPWEVLAVVDLVDEVVDEPEKAKQEKDKLKKTVSMFRRSAIYLRHYIDLIEWSEDEQPAKELAQDLAREFYQFSRSLLRKKRVFRNYNNIPRIDLIGNDINDEDKFRQLEQDKYEVEAWLTGTDFLLRHFSRLQARLGREPTVDEVEVQRQKMLKTFFKSLSRERFDQLDFKNIEEDDMDLADTSWREYSVVFLGVPEDELSEREKQEKSQLEKNFLQTRFWKKVGPNLLLQLSTVLRVKQIFSKPVSEMEKVIFRKGKNNLIQALKEAPGTDPEQQDGAVIDLLKDGFGLNVEEERKLLAEKIEVERLKKELQELKDNGASLEIVSQKELEIVDLIQAEVSQYQYELTASMPAEIAVREQVNCVGAVLVSGMLFDAIGIKYLVGLVKGHTANFVVTTDNQVHFRDMRISAHNCKIDGEQFDETNLAKLNELVELGEPDVINITANKDWYKKISLYNGVPDPRIQIFQPEQGIYSMVMNNFSFVANGSANYGFLDVEVLTTAIENYLDFVPNDALMIGNLAILYIDQGFTEAAALYLYRLEQISPNSSDNMLLWATLFMKIDRFDLAIEACRGGLIINSQNQELWEMLLEIYGENDEVDNYLSTCFQARFNVDFVGFTQKAINLLVKENRYEEALKQDQHLLDQLPDSIDLWVQYLEHRMKVFVNEESTYRQLCDWYWNTQNYQRVWEVVLAAATHNSGAEWMTELLEDYRFFCGQKGIEVSTDIIFPNDDLSEKDEADFDIPALV